MTPPIAFDPASPARIKDAYAGFVEVTLAPSLHGESLHLVAHDSEGLEVAEFLLRPDFLDEFLAQARAREAQDAA